MRNYKIKYSKRSIKKVFKHVFLWCVVSAFYIAYITVTEDIRGAIQKLRK